jgi:hypothetical protein
VQKGPTLVEARFIGGACLGDPASEGAGHGRKHPRPCIVGIGVGFRGDPRGPPQDLRQGRRRGSGGPWLYGGRPPFATRHRGCPLWQGGCPRAGRRGRCG